MNVHCRLCGGELVARFEATLLGRHRVTFHECCKCGSLQTDPPDWLDEAYADPRPISDTGIVQRTLESSLFTTEILSILGVKPEHVCVDFGGGNGLFSRMMRDRGYNFFCYDRYVDPFYVPHHVVTDHAIKKATVLTCFEVLEHLPNPVEDLKEIFSFQPDILIATSECYRNQGADWSYLSVENGQHVFFYSIEALDLIAQTYGYRLVSSGGIHIFYRLSADQLTIDPMVMRQLGRDLIHGAVRVQGIRKLVQDLATPYLHVLNDHQIIIERYYREAQPEPPKLVIQSAPRPPLVCDPSPILVDGVIFQLDEVRGVARVWREILQQWANTDFGKRIIVLDRAGTAPPTPGLRRVLCNYRPEKSLLSDAVLLQDYCDRLGAKAFASTYLSGPETTPSAMVVHDMIPELLPDFFASTKYVWDEKTAYVKAAQKIVCVSDSTRRDLLAIHPEVDSDNVEVAHLGVCASFTPQSSARIQSVCQSYGIDQPYLLQVGGRSAYKNAHMLINAWLRLPEEARPLLVFVGGEPMQEEVRKVVGDKLRHVTGIDDFGLASLYGGAIAMVMPSLYEGFGLPVAEAMACKCPVICSSTSSLPEVAGGAAILVDPGNTQEMKQAIQKVQDPAIRKEMIARGRKRAAEFSWATIADALQDALETLADR